MGPAYFVIAILGCADGGSACTPVATLERQYASEAQCVAATGAALIENSDFDYPTLVARCRPAETQSAEAREKKPREKARRG
jgi:acyl-CoA synthetase (AMP-forming)/AMP-acid ligase II